jgi:ABC-2 type transport system ATP-binding protein
VTAAAAASGARTAAGGATAAHVRATTAGDALVARDVVHEYPGRRALDGVSFAVREAEIYGFLGPNGSGKSTLFRLLATLLPPQQSEVTLCGHSLRAEPDAVRRALGVVFQAPSLDLELTVEENLLLQARLHAMPAREARAAAERGLVRFGLADRRGERVRALSGGLRRRVELARAALHQPRLLLLDEPSTGLDPGARRAFWEELERLRAELGTTVVLTTHFMEEADRCDRLALLHRGRIVAEATPEALKAEVGGDTVSLLTSDAAALRSAVAARLPAGSELWVVGNAVRFASADAHRLAGMLMAELGAQVSAVTVAHPTLEDVFLRHTGEALD